jgi:hypothetical protein
MEESWAVVMARSFACSGFRARIMAAQHAPAKSIKWGQVPLSGPLLSGEN